MHGADLPFCAGDLPVLAVLLVNGLLRVVTELAMADLTVAAHS